MEQLQYELQSVTYMWSKGHGFRHPPHRGMSGRKRQVLHSMSGLPTDSVPARTVLTASHKTPAPGAEESSFRHKQTFAEEESSQTYFPSTKYRPERPSPPLP